MPESKIRKRKQFIGEHVACACGCGATFNPFTRDGHPKRFVSGHNIDRAMIQRAVKASLSRPDSKVIRSEAGKKAWKDPAYRQRMAESVQRQWADPEFRQKTLTAAHRGTGVKWKDPEYRQRMRENGKRLMAALHQNQDAMAKAREAQRVRLNRLWKNPEFIEKIARAHANQCGTLRTSKPELRLREFLREIGQAFQINRRFVLDRGYTVPDAFIETRSMAIYSDGTYWHGREAKKRRDMEQRAALGSMGIRVFVIDQGKSERAEFQRLREALSA